VSSSYCKYLLNVDEESDARGSGSVEEVATSCVQDHLAEFVPVVTLSGNGLSNGYRDVAAIRFLGDIED
jgi:hypothetical protein